MDLVAGGASDVGRVRTVNQDSWLVTEGLWAVADGMGGHQGGEVASQITIETLSDEVDEPSPAALTNAAKRANAAVYQQASDHANLRGMGTTLCAMALVREGDDEELAIVNVGDSRIYQWRDEVLTQITRDHSLVEDMRAAGQITDAEAAVHPNRNIVTRALGNQPDVEVDEFVVVPRSGDRYVLCSDGLFNEINAEKIAATLRRLAAPEDAASELVRQANEAGGRDNITCVVVDVVDDAGAADRAAAAGVASIRRRDRGPDVAGITTADIGDDGERPVADEALPESTEPPKPKARLRRVTWRTAGFGVLLLAILAIAALAVLWYSRGTYYVGYGKNGEVTIFKGRPKSVLWFDPTVAERTGIARAQVPDALRDALVEGKQQSSLADARAYIARMRAIICSDLRNGAVPPAPAPGAPTTTIPSACADLASSSSGSTETGTATTAGSGTAPSARRTTTTTR